MSAKKGRIVVIQGLIARMPVAGVVWQTLHYLIGFQRLGYSAYYVEAHGGTPREFFLHPQDDGHHKAAAFIARIMKRFDLSDQWAYDPGTEGGECMGMPKSELTRLYEAAALVINLHGATKPRPNDNHKDRLIYLETDPVALQIQLYRNRPSTIEFLEQHAAYFTFAENYGGPTCGLPYDERYHFNATRQPVIPDLWDDYSSSSPTVFTTIGNWRQSGSDITYKGETYRWSKHYEFEKFLDLPSLVSQPFELALSSVTPDETTRLTKKGWNVRPGIEVSQDIDMYRDYIARSRGEFTVAKDQNVRLRTGWFSDRSATYLAAGKPVITQDTGIAEHLPTGMGLFTYNSLEEAVTAIETINRDYEVHRARAKEIAREYFSYDVVLNDMLRKLGL